MNNRKGRPTDSKKELVIRARVDNKTIEKLDKCTDTLEMTRSEVIRRGINEVYYNTFEMKHLPPEDSRRLAWVINALPHATTKGIITERENEILKLEIRSINDIKDLTKETRALIEKVVHEVTAGKREYLTLLKEEGQNE